MRYRWLQILLVAMALCNKKPASAQQSIDTLRNAEVQGQRSAATNTESKLSLYSPGTKTYTFDSATLDRYRQQSVATLLSQQSPVFIRSYGFNNLATLQFRGASAAQSLVVWNGVPLQNAATGITDISLLPVMLADDISLQFGSSAALLGSGNVGGALLLNSRPPPDSALREITLYAGGGSFSQRQLGGRARYNVGRWRSQGRFFYQQAANDFEYAGSGGERKRLGNATTEGWSASLDGTLLVNRQNELNVHGWLHQYDRGIPPALFERQSVQQFTDGASRIAADWQHHGRTAWYVRVAGLGDRLVYEDSSIRVRNDAMVTTFFGEAGIEKAIGKRQRLLIFLPAQHSTLFTKDTAYLQVRVAIAFAHQLRLMREGRLVIASGLRAERVEEQDYLLPGMNISYRVASWMQVKLNGQRTYRVPTLNELYYNPGGNPALKPESGWNADGGYVLRFAFNKNLVLKHEVSVYSRRIDNWVAWFGGAIWTPHNIAAVHSRGVELDYELSFPAGPVRIRAASHGAWSRSTTERSVLPGDNSIGKQVPYAPQWLAQGTITGEWRGWIVSVHHSYTGVRYVTTDESFALPSYQLTGLQAAWNGHFKKIALRLDASCNNVFDHRYTVVASRPMPGRYYTAGMSLSYRRGALREKH